MIHAARYHSLGEMLEDAFLTWPTELAVIEADRDRETVRLSYQAFRQESRRVSAWLTQEGLAGARVAIVMANQARWLLAAAGALHVGCVLVPLDSRMTPDEQRALLRHSGARVLFTDVHLAANLALAGLRQIVSGAAEPLDGVVRFEELPPAADLPPARRTRSDIACIVYSSGTGGEPKGCMLTHGNYLSQYQALTATFDWRRGDRYLSILPTNHAIDFMCGFIASLCTGATIIHQRTLRPELILATMRRYRVTQMAVVPLILQAFERSVRERLDEQTPERRRVVDTLLDVNTALTRRSPNQAISRWLLKPIHDAFGGCLRVLYCGGAFTPREQAEFFYRLGLPVAIGYGLTEACTVATVNDLRPFRGDSVGAAVPGVRVRIHDARGPEGIGEVQISGPTVFRGYLDDAELTAAAFDGEWLRTGDLGWLDGAHHLHLVGRSRNMIVTAGGKNVYPEDIEAAFHQVPCEELLVFADGYIGGQTGLTDERLVAVVRPGQRTDAEVTRALALANRSLPDFRRISAWYRWDKDFPRTASMKVKRAELADQLRAGLSPDGRHALSP